MLANALFTRVKYFEAPHQKLQQKDLSNEEQKNDFQPDLHCCLGTLHDSLREYVLVRHNHLFPSFNDLVERQVILNFSLKKSGD